MYTVGFGLGLLLCGLVALLLGGTPTPARQLAVAIQDDAVLLHGSDASVHRAISQIAWLGATDVRLTASWSTLAPQPRSPRVPPAPFDPANAATYAAAPFHELDRAVQEATSAGLEVMIDVAFFAPRWAVPIASPDGHNRYRPDPALFGAFARAVAQRYDGHTRDPADRDQTLPAVRLYTVWNEPNHAQFLEPQWRHAATGWVAESPNVYRHLYRSAYAAIKDVDPGNRVLIGATAPDGSTTRGRGNVAPLEFVRGLSCVGPWLTPLRTQECRGFQPLAADGYAHHPYSLGHPPATASVNPGDVPLADAGRLERLLDALHGAHRFTTDLPLYETEYGYETNPPDPFGAISLQDQARFIGWSTFLAWRDPGTRMFAQFLLRDSAPNPGKPGSRVYWRSYQTGLYYHDGSPKPAAEAFRLPFWAQRIGVGAASPLVLLFGQARAAHGRQLVQVEQLSPDASRWLPVHTLTKACNAQGQFFTDRAGFFVTAASFGGSPTFRLGWRRPDGVWEYGVPLSVAPSDPVWAGPAEAQPGSTIGPALRLSPLSGP
jgi:hypothetical protein